MNKKQGKQTIFFESKPYIRAFASTAGSKEAKGPFGKCFDITTNDVYWGEKSWEKAENKFVKKAVYKALEKGKLEASDIDILFAGDLLNQCTGTSYGIIDFNIPFVGLFGACSTMGLSMKMAAMSVDGGFATRCAAVTSSHFCSAERQFRFPLEYGGQRPPSAQWTVTGSGCVIIDKEEGDIRLDCATTGKVVDLGIKDANNMGAAMAPSAIDTLTTHFKDTNRTPDYYDAIFSGDLGSVGKAIVIDLMKKRGYDLSKNYFDCGEMIFDKSQDVHAGGSGCGCSALILCAHILPQLLKRNFKKVLFMPTGALMSPTAVQQGGSIPGVAHAISLFI